jgi:peptidoglycan hydrolase-like protein with peptidoglycan-binding domain
MKGVMAIGAALVFAAGAAGTAAAQERQALLIGNAEYRDAPEAQTAVRDVRAVGGALEEAGWEVSLSVNLNRAEMRKALKSFAESAADAEDILIYYSGHALRTGGRTYLAPVDQQASALVEVLFDGVPLEVVLRVAGMASGEGVVFIDGAQLEGFEPTPFVEPGLADVEAPDGVVVISAAPPGQAIRRSPDRDSRFARLIVDRFLLPGAEVMATANAVGRPTWVTGESQTAFVLAPPPEPIDEGDLAQEIELAYWRAAERSGRAEDYREYLDRYPDGVFAEFARDRLDVETAAQVPQQPEVDPAYHAERALNLSRIRTRQVQQWLRATGFEPGSVDGLMGPNTRDALRGWQRAEGFDVTGYLNRAQIDRLSAQGEAALAEQRRHEDEQRHVAEAEDRGYWAATGADGTAAGYRAYLQRYPEGVHAAEARTALGSMAEAKQDDQLRQERRRFRQARQADTAEAYREYLAVYPQGVWRADALARLDEIEGAERATAEQSRAEQTEAALALNAKDRQSVEQRLRSLGFEPGPIDGEFDQRSRAAIEGYQSSRGIDPTGYLNRETVVGIVQETNEAQQGQLIINGTDVVRGLIEAFGGAIQGSQ